MKEITKILCRKKWKMSPIEDFDEEILIASLYESLNKYFV